MNSIANTAIDAFVLYADEKTMMTLSQLKEEPLVRNIYVMMKGGEECPCKGCEVIRVDDYRSSATIRKMTEALKAPFALLCTAQTPVTFGLIAKSHIQVVIYH